MFLGYLENPRTRSQLSNWQLSMSRKIPNGADPVIDYQSNSSYRVNALQTVLEEKEIDYNGTVILS